ncbi:MAG: zinc ribbon domain-containing protein [Desulfovibrio sp.]|uniref:zinc ribbon domain-containing protein n=1 Tax=Desulfovibrio sp. 7SRBS1 TaxID=3378064 RepID=UPI003B3C4869
MYQKQIEQLVVLQKLDGEILVLEQEIDNAPKELKELEERYGAAQTQQEQIVEKIGILKEQQKRLGTEIEDDAVKIKKSKSKLMMASNTREYHAMMREMDNMEKLNRLREEENVTLTEEIARQEDMLTQMDSNGSSLEDELKEHRASLDVRIGKAQKALNELMKNRAVSCEIIPKPILSRYEFIRSRLANPVIVPVESGICTGCHIAIPPQTYNELQRGKQIHSCPNCQRLIYWDQHLPSAEEKSAE